jgi:hypothetical protein
MRDFFVEPRHAAGFHVLILYIKVFSNPHKGFYLRRTFSTLEVKTRGERNSAEKDPFRNENFICWRIPPPGSHESR